MQQPKQPLKMHSPPPPAFQRLPSVSHHTSRCLHHSSARSHLTALHPGASSSCSQASIEMSPRLPPSLHSTLAPHYRTVFSYLNAQSRKGVRDFRREDWGREGGQCGLTATSFPMDLCSCFLLTTYYPGPSPALSRVRTHRPLTSSRHSCYCFCFMVISTPRPRPRQPRSQPEDSMLSFRGKSRRSSPWRQDGSRPQRSPRLHPSLKEEGEQKEWWCPAHESLWVWGASLKVAEQ